MINWREIPFVRLLLPFISGILLYIYLPGYLPQQWLLAVGAWCAGVLFYLNFAKTRWQWRWLYGLCLTGLLLAVGWQRTYRHDERHYSDHFQQYLQDENQIAGYIQQLQPTSTGKARAQLRVAAIQDSSASWQPATGHLLVYLDSKALMAWDYGDCIALQARISPIEVAKNPKSFDFARFMHFKNVHYQAFVKPGDYELVAPAEGLHPMLVADRLRDRCVAILRKHFPTDNELAVASALILGYRDEITEEVRTAYANTGAMHVLAVSGLHVGFVYLGISFLLGLIKSRDRRWKIARTVLEILGIWAFALLTGASPSVMRASTMFSFIIVGRALRRDTNIYNTLAASAFFLLCLNPYYIMEVGFQLSYLAVLGIVYFQPKIYKLLYIKNKLGDYIWKLSAVSLAAQITTLPISLYYFHQFPLYFWLSGLVVVPIAVVILSGGFLLFITDMIPGWSWLLGKALYGIVALVNQAIFLIQQIPGSLVTGIWISFGVVLALYGIIAFIIIAINTRQFRWLMAALGGLAAVGLAHGITQWQVHQQSVVAVYHLNRHTAIDYFDGKQLVALTDEDAPAKSLRFAQEAHRWYRRSHAPHAIDLDPAAAFEVYQLGKITLAIVQNAIQTDLSPSLSVDYVLICHNPRVALEALLAPFEGYQKVIFDASNNWRSVAQWQTEAATMGIRTYDVQAQGAWVLGQ
ncbi:MAG TPA: ComEC/Rec2 family competence protein [Saprospiraceae bacterium]|nr:ComEC/Rec2 family competence protein [Saprospiraceae bacterium]HMP24690.1 ComEC/Rec2 family competence protein [Saprospiraceae bacterium]